MNRAKLEEFKRIAAQNALIALNDDVVVLDTETTGLDVYSEIVEVAAISIAGDILVNTLVAPVFRIPKEATEIHGITENDVNVTGVPTWVSAAYELSEAIKGRKVAIYNASFDLKMMRQSKEMSARFSSYQSEHFDGSIDMHSGVCVMKMYAAFYGDWNDERGEFKWQKLINAAEQMGIEFTGQAHRALADAQVTLELLKRMADYADKHGEA